MRKIILLNMLLFWSILAHAQIINFPDANFKTALLARGVDSNNDGNITVQEAETVTHLQLNELNINDLTGIEYFVSLTSLEVSGNNLTQLDLSQNTALRVLWCAENEISSLDLTNSPRLTDLACYKNKLTQLNISNSTNTDLKTVYCFKNQLTALDLSFYPNIDIVWSYENKLEFLILPPSNSKLRALRTSDNLLTEINVDHSPDLISLEVGANRLTSLNVENNLNLEYLTCSRNPLNTVSVEKNTELKTLRVEGINATSLDISKNTKLTQLWCGYNRSLGSLDVSANIELGWLSCVASGLTSLDVSNNRKLNVLSCSNNPLQELNLHLNTELRNLNCQSTEIEVLDVRSCALTSINFGYNSNLVTARLTGQDFKIAPHLGIQFKYCPKLDFICVDEEYIAPIQNLFNDPAYTTCNVGSECTTNFYTIAGNFIYDADGDGCDANDEGFSDIKLNISNSFNNDIDVFPLLTGEYNALVYDETSYFLSTGLENPDYFDVSANNIASIRFPRDAPGVNRDFCVTAKGIHHDVEITMFPISQARPGFDASYTIIYKNKGTASQSGTITLDYLEDILTLVSAQPTQTSISANQISWDFKGLKPLESRTINISMNVNKPTDTPPVNDGDILSFTAVADVLDDEEPDDNSIVINQTVVNSYDPNDKTCLQGDTLAPEKVGEYLHYLIRFENEGTASAVNIEIKDDIDTTTLDIASFVPIQASHNYTTKVNNDKEIVFTFENIHLPFDDLNNDGYVLFKIKTKSTLIQGAKIKNKAAIYFDFNPPIITNEEVVTVYRAPLSDHSFDDYFTLSPNPTSGIMILEPKFSAKNIDEYINEITIHDKDGNVLIRYPRFTRTIDVTRLPAGNYYLVIDSPKINLATRFVKTK